MAKVPHRLLWACVLWGLAGAALADAGAHFSTDAWVVASDDELATLRGGFEAPNGLAVSFGFVRSVTINGDLVAETRFSLPDLTHISAEQAQQVGDALAAAHIVQNGVGNSVATGSTLNALSASTIVQNSLNNQLIQTQTIIDSGVNSLGLLHALNTQGTLRDALAGALGLR